MSGGLHGHRGGTPRLRHRAMTSRLHVLDPGIRMRPTATVMVHQRTGALLCEGAGAVWRRRPLGLRSKWPGPCAGHVRWRHWTRLARGGLHRRRPRGARCASRRGDEESSACESCWCTPTVAPSRRWRAKRGLSSSTWTCRCPNLQYEIVDHCGDLWRVDFAWPDDKGGGRVRQHGMARQSRDLETRSAEGRATARSVGGRRCRWSSTTSGCIPTTWSAASNGSSPDPREQTQTPLNQPD